MHPAVIFLIIFSSLSCLYHKTLTTEWVEIPSGYIKINNEKIFIKSFLLQPTEVTLAEFAEFIEATRYSTSCEKAGKGYAIVDHKWTLVPNVNWRHDKYGNPITKEAYQLFPVTNVSLNDALAYAKWIDARLPTLVEFTYASYGDKKTKYSGSNNPKEVAWYDENSSQKIQPVATKKANNFFLYDLSGNVFEYVYDNKNNQYFAKGGSYFNDKEFLEINDPGWEVKDWDEAIAVYGFRCAKDIKDN